MDIRKVSLTVSSDNTDTAVASVGDVHVAGGIDCHTLRMIDLRTCIAAEKYAVLHHVANMEGSELNRGHGGQ